MKFYTKFTKNHNREISRCILSNNHAMMFLIKYMVSGNGIPPFFNLAERLSFSVLPLEAKSDKDMKYNGMTIFII